MKHIIKLNFNFLFGLVSIFYFKIFKTDSSLVSELSVFLILATIVLLLFIFSYEQPIYLSFSEKISFLLFSVFFLKNIAINKFDFATTAYLTLLVLLYFALKKTVTAITVTTSSKILFAIFLVTLFCFVVFAAHHCFIKKETLDNFYLPNKSVFGILLASQICFVVPLFTALKSQVKSKLVFKYGVATILLLALFLLIATNSRAAWLGLVAALVFILINYYKPKINKKLAIAFAIIGFVILTTVLFFYKSNSSNGRLLIYKVSTTILKDNWLFGIGTGQFKTQYNLYQTNYFATHTINSKEALLADNSFFAFNDYFQLVIENGILGIVFLIVFSTFLYKQIKASLINNSPIFIAATSSLICILITALFSYPFQFLPIAIQSLFCLSIINSSTPKQISNKASKILNPTFVLLGVVCLVHYCFYYSYQQKAKLASDLSRAGYKTKAIEKYKQLGNCYIKDGNVLYKYAQELYYTNNTKDAANVLEDAKRQLSTNEIYKLSASINMELKNYKQAEQDYKTAINMVPNRMLSRKELLDFYIVQKDTVNAIFWANSILNMPVKVPSTITKNTQQRTAQILLQLTK